MYLEQITIENFRVLQYNQLLLAERINVVTGDNASGKSSLLEAIHLLSTGRSFRTSRVQDMIQQGKSSVLVAAKAKSNTDATSYPLGIRKSAKATQIRINHQTIKQQAELSRHLPFTIIHPDTLQLITGGAAIRRAVVDWVAFYRHADFHGHWKQYKRTLQQRNSCLRESDQRYALDYWTDQMVSLSVLLQSKRQQSLQWLQQGLEHYQSLTQNLGTIELRLSSGFPAHLDATSAAELLYFIKGKQAQEIMQGFSLYGAHRADLQISMAGQLAERIASRGELKLLSIAILLAKSYAIAEEAKQRGVLGVDDLAAELDVPNQQRLYQTLLDTEQQLFITGTQLPSMLIEYKTKAHFFYVKQGLVLQQDSF